MQVYLEYLALKKLRPLMSLLVKLVRVTYIRESNNTINYLYYYKSNAIRLLKIYLILV